MGSPVLTTSKASPVMDLRSPRWSSLQRGSGAPETYQLEPLSATIMPYFLSAVQMTWTSAEAQEQSYEAFMRKRRPIGGAFVLVSLEASCVAGWMNAAWVSLTVKRSAWLITPSWTTSE